MQWRDLVSHGDAQRADLGRIDILTDCGGFEFGAHAWIASMSVGRG